MAKLILVRHGISEWNAIGLWTGWTDVPLTDDGRAEARNAAELLRGTEVARAHTSDLARANETLDIMLEALGLRHISVRKSSALKERHYGIFTGHNKWKLKEVLGAEEFEHLRRGWNYPVSGGETLKTVYKRIVPYYREQILPDLLAGANVLVVAHNNSLRALLKHLENLGEEEIAHAEVGTGEVLIYEIDAKGAVTGKKVMAENKLRGKV